jgi:hypothetical protein
MPTLACHVCGRVVYATVPLDTLFAEERRCPRCGSILEAERREDSRRKRARRQQPPDDPGPPDNVERRIADRRQNRRRRDDGTNLDNL